MLTDECDMRPFLEKRGIEVIETDLGERIQQLDDEPPSHIVVPAVHKLRTDVAAGLCARPSAPTRRTATSTTWPRASARHTRPYFLTADAGMTGANFAVAETGSVVVCTNEGNADLSVHLPKLYIASIGIEKMLPRIEHLGVFVRMLSRSALGSPITQLTSHFRAPRKGTEMHIVLVDNGRSERLGMADFWYSLKCIRCGACMNTCPVYRRSGGLSYGATYSGPIGVIIDPTFNLRKYSSLPFASTLNGSCTSVCPVQDQHPRADLQVARRSSPSATSCPIVKQEAMRVAGKILGSPKLYRAAVEAAGAGVEHLPRFMMYNRLNAWGRQREVPAAPPSTFRQWYLENRRRRRTSAMSSRDEILARVRKNQPPAQPLPSLPAFGRDGQGAARDVQGRARAHGRQVRRSARRRRSRPRSCAACFPTPKVICSATPEVAGNRPHRRRCGAPADLRRRRRRRRARGVRRRRDRFGVADRARVRGRARWASCRSTSSCCSTRRASSPPARRVPASAADFDARYGVFMTGPSATADIEGVLIHGAQGIRSLTVVPVAGLSRPGRT